jgi:TonB-dependent receptor
MISKNYYLLFISILFSISIHAQNATIKGRVTDSKSHEPLPGANIGFDGSAKGVITDSNGQYELANLPQGHYKIKVRYIGYNEYEKEGTISLNQVITLNIALVASTHALQAVSIYGKLDNETEAASRANEKNSDNIKNVISAQAIAKSPDINAANVLQRVSGVTIQRNAGGDDAYPIIRGIEPRYNNTLINGVKIASPESKSRFVSLSVVPIGGTVNLVFKDAPDQREITATGSLGYSQMFLDRKFTKFSTADVQKYSPGELHGADYAATPESFSRTNLDFKQVTPPPTGTLAFSYGERYLKNKLGFEIGNTYQSLFFGSNSDVNQAARGANTADHAPIITNILSRQFSTHQQLNNFIVHLDYRINDKNKISIDNTLLYSHLLESAIATDTSLSSGNGGRTIPGTGPISHYAVSTTTNQIIENIKLAGNHILTKHFLFNWTGAYSNAGVRNPDRATLQTTGAITYDPATGQFTSVPTVFDGIGRTWQHNNDQILTGSGNLSYTKTFNDNSFIELKTGGLYRHSHRNNFQDDYSLNPILSGNRKEGFTDIYSVTFTVFNPGGSQNYNPVNYIASEDVTAFYGQFKLSLPRLDIIGGVRSETTNQSFTLGSDNPYSAVGLQKSYTDLLPSIDFKFKVNEKTNLRASYYKSIARPGYFDLVPIQQPTNGPVIIQGNQNLLHTTADNFDFRYEFFPKEEEQIYLGAYYKKLTNPIEVKINGNSGAQQIQQPINTNSATVAGFELVLTKFIGKIGISGNYAYTYSDVYDQKRDKDAPQNEIFEHRKLSGASVHDLNASLLFKDTKNKINLQLAYQFLGSTLVQLYTYNGDDFIQKPQSVLAFSGDIGLSKHFTLFTKWNNILNTHTVVQIHGINTANEFTKATYLVGLRYNY